MTDSLGMEGAGGETGAVSRPSQILEVCELLDGVDVHMEAGEEASRTVGFHPEAGKGRGFPAWQCHCLVQCLENSLASGTHRLGNLET